MRFKYNTLCTLAYALQLLLITILTRHAAASSAGVSLSDVDSYSELHEIIYTDMTGGDACIRLLNAQGTVGCAAPSKNSISGLLVKVDKDMPPSELPDNAVVLLSPSAAGPFLQNCASTPDLCSQVSAVLIQYTDTYTDQLWNPASTFPQAAFALYNTSNNTSTSSSSSTATMYEWNPRGNGISTQNFNFPIFQLDNATTTTALDRATYNNIQGMQGALNYASMELYMEATGNSSNCIKQQNCLPLGGYSVWASIPYMPSSTDGSTSNTNSLPTTATTDSTTTTSTVSAASTNSYEIKKPIIMVSSQIDTSALFHNLAQASNYPLSGLITLLTTAEILGNATRLNNKKKNNNNNELVDEYKQRIVFNAFQGEPWGYMGSKMMLWMMESNSSDDAVKGLELENISAFIEVGPVGNASLNTNTQQLQLYAHTEKGGSPSGAASQPIITALQTAATLPLTLSTTSTEQQQLNNDINKINIQPASSTTPGLPPSSASSFLRMKTSLPAVYLAEFNEAYIDGAFNTQFDIDTTIQPEAIAATAIVLARTLHTLALNTTTTTATSTTELPVDYSATLATVKELMSCLTTNDPGFYCDLALQLFTPTTNTVPHYISILRSTTADTQLPDPNAKSNIEQFIWNFLAFATAGIRPGSISGTSSSSGSSNDSGSSNINTVNEPLDLPRCRPNNATQCPANTLCAGFRDIEGYNGTGVCLGSTVRYVPAWSTSLLCNGCNGTETLYDYLWTVTDVASGWEQEYGWPVDAMWTESNWPSSSPSLMLYLKESEAVEYVVLGVGIVTSVAAVVGVLVVRRSYYKRLKQS